MRRSIIIAVVSLCMVQTVHADVQTFVNDYPGFAAASGPLTLIDFETQPNGQPSQGGVQITASYNYDDSGAHFSAANVTPILAGNPDSGFDLRATTDPPLPGSRTWIIADPLEFVYAAGGSFGGSSYLFAYDVAGQLLGWAHFSGGGTGHFLGIVSDVPIDYVVFDRGSWLASIDSFHFSPVPEPCTLILVTLTLLRMKWIRRHE